MVRFLGVLVIPSAFEGRVTVTEMPEVNSVSIQVNELNSQDNINDLIKSFEVQVGAQLKIEQVSPDQMSLSTQEWDRTK